MAERSAILGAPVGEPGPSGPPGKEIGAQSQQVGGYGGWASFVDEAEYVPDLTWPQSITSFHRMRSDSQVEALHLGTVQPIREFRFSIDPNKAPAKVVEQAAADLGLPILGHEDDPIERSRSTFDFDQFLSDALLAPLYGHFHFEIVGGDEEGNWRMDKLSPRHPRTLAEFAQATTGELTAIRQNIGGAGVGGWSKMPPPIPASKLIPFVWRPEAGSHIGRALDPETPIPSPDGWRRMGDLQTGDRVFDEAGAIRHVTARADWEDRPCYEVEFSSGEIIVADAEHQWLSHHYKQRHLGGKPEIVTTREMAETVEKYGRKSNHAMPMAGPLEYVHQHLLVDPYVLGFWLGDGTATCAEITTMDPEVIAECERRGYEATMRRPSPSHKPTRADHYALAGGLQERLRVLGLLRNKHVPEQYLRGDYQQRLDLLRGLMDSDGNVGGKNGARGEFTNTNPLLSEAVLEIARSLGGRGTLIRVARPPESTMGQPISPRKDVYKVAFHTGDAVPFLLTRKAVRYDRKGRGARRHHYVRAVRPTTNRATVCIEVDSPSHLFLAGRSLIATHNSMLRSIYREWLVKDRVIRIAAINLERAGGVPVIEGAPGSSDEQLRDLAELARQFKVAEGGGGAIPFGSKLSLVGGNVPDAIALLKYCDECMARVWALMLIQLGVTSGANRALGGEFAVYAARFQRSMAKWVKAQMDRFLDNYVEWNDPFSSYAPLLHFEQSRPDATSVTDLVAMVESDLITADPELEGWLRSEYGLPEAPKPQTDPNLGDLSPEEVALVQNSRTPPELPAAPTKPSPTLDPTSIDPTVASGRYWRRWRGITAALQLPDRKLHREPTENEIRAAVDFRSLDRAHADVYAGLHDEFMASVLPKQIAALGDAIRTTKDGTPRTTLTKTAMAKIEAPLEGVDLLKSSLTEAARTGASAAQSEMEAQGVVHDAPTTEALTARISDQATAVAELAANGISLAAQRKASSLISDGGRTPDEVAKAVEDHLSGMRHAWTREQLKGAVTMAQNQGRIAAFVEAKVEEEPTYEASELLDDRTCDPCDAVDGKVYANLEEASEDYAAGGYVECEGGPACRGTLIAVFPEQNTMGGEGALAEPEPAYSQVGA